MARMGLANILVLYRARLRARAVLVQEGLAVLGIAVGVALLFASQVASTSLSGSVTQLDRQVVGSSQFQLDARGSAGFKERLLEQARSVPGVQVALPVLEQQANVIGPSGQRSVDLIGTDPRLAHVGGPLLKRFFTGQLANLHAIALPAPIARGIGAGTLESVKLQVGDRVVKAVLAVLGENEIGGIIGSPVALTSLRYAQHALNMQGRITRIFIQSRPGSEREVGVTLGRLAKMTGVNLEPSNYDSLLFASAVAPESRNETLFSVISALVGFLFALNAMLITVPARRRLIKEVRLQGSTRLMVVQILLFDAAALGVLACVLGLALGELLSRIVFGAAPGYLSLAFPVGSQRIVTWHSVVFAIGAGLTATIVGVLWPLRDAFSRPLQDDVVVVGHGRRWIAARLVGGVASLALTAVIPDTHNQGAIVGNIMLIVALLCLSPLLFDGLVAVFARVQRLAGGPASALATIQLQSPRARVRFLAIVATVAVAVFGAVEFQGVQRNLTSGIDASIRALDANAAVWVSAGGESNAFATTSFADSYSTTLARLPGVSAVGLYRGSFLDWGDQRLWVLGQPADVPEPVPVSQIVNGDASLARIRIRQGGWAVLSRALAAEHNLHVGDGFSLPSPRSMRLRVAALSTNLGWPSGAIIMNANDYARAWGSGNPSAYKIQATPGTSAATVRSQVLRALGPGTGLVVETSGQREGRHHIVAAQGLARLTQIRLLVLIAAMLAVAAAMSSMLWQRRDLIAFMKVDGYRKGVLWRWLLCESAVLLGAGCSIGAVFGLYGQFLGSHFLSNVTGFPVVFNIEALATLASFALVTLLATAVATVPGYFVVRVPPRAVSPAY
jgi:putative ABC transport system permease protein